MLSSGDRQLLLGVARRAIGSALGVPGEEPSLRHAPALQQPAGAFVTLHLHGELRGCIGYIEPLGPLAITVREAAARAAFSDPRFVPVTREEYPSLQLEISVLSPMRRIADPQEVEVGKHGLMLEWRHHHGLLLPQVAMEYGWSRTEFLNHTARKAGLPPTAWREPDAVLQVFTAEVFNEASFAEEAAS